MRKIRLWRRSDAVVSYRKYALIDDGDLEKIVSFTWTANRNPSGGWYAACSKKNILMHRLIMDAKPGQKVDHINGNGLDNRRQNLRFATTSQNGMNSRGKPNRSGRFKGVMYEKARGLYSARIKVNGKYLNLGRFRTDVAGAWAYDEAARKYYGEFARVNGVKNPGDDGSKRNKRYSKELKLAVLKMADKQGRAVARDYFQLPDYCIDEFRKSRRNGFL